MVFLVFPYYQENYKNENMEKYRPKSTDYTSLLLRETTLEVAGWSEFLVENLFTDIKKNFFFFFKAHFIMQPI